MTNDVKVRCKERKMSQVLLKILSRFSSVTRSMHAEKRVRPASLKRIVMQFHAGMA